MDRNRIGKYGPNSLVPDIWSHTVGELRVVTMVTMVTHKFKACFVNHVNERRVWKNLERGVRVVWSICGTKSIVHYVA